MKTQSRRENTRPRFGMTNLSNITEPVISIIIPSYNSRKTIEKCLNALIEQKSDTSHEIIFVDSSDDGTTEFVRKGFPEVKIIHFEEKTIPSKARNVGIENANGDILAFTDSDCIVDSNWLVEITKALNSDCDVVGGSTVNAYPFNPISVAETVYYAVVAANKSATVSQITGASDAAIQSNVDDVVDNLFTKSGV